MATKLDGPDPIDMQVGVTLRDLRRKRGLSQQAVGAALGVTFQQLQKYERGLNRISASMLVRAASALGVQPADLLPRSDAPPMHPTTPLLNVRGAPELLEGYAAIPSARHRRAVLALVKALRDLEDLPEPDDFESVS